MPSLAHESRVVKRVKQLGHCIELVSLDPHFNEVSVGLFIKNGVLTISSFSILDGIEDRIVTKPP